MIYRLALILLLSGCGGNTTVIKWHDGKVIEIVGSGDKQLIEMKIGSDTVKLDSRSSSFFRDFFNSVMMMGTRERRIQ